MDARVENNRPLYVDLDGTLIKSDLLWETLFLLARQDIRHLTERGYRGARPTFGW